MVTADHVSGGRIDVGLGAGWHEREHEAHGFPFQPTKTRVDVLEEQLEILIGAWGEERFSFRASTTSLSGLDAQPKPMQRPHPPLLMGGNARTRERRARRPVRREYNTPFPSLEQIRRRKANIDEACERAGPGADPVLGHGRDGARRRRGEVWPTAHGEWPSGPARTPRRSVRDPPTGLDGGDARAGGRAACAALATPGSAG